MDLKDRIKLLRAEKGITATQLAAQINKGESAIRMWETGRSKPDADTLIKLAEYFNCTTDYLLGLSDHKNLAEKEQAEDQLKTLFVYVEGLPFKAKEKLYFSFQAIVNSYTRAKGDAAIQDSLLSCLHTLADNIGQTTIDVFENRTFDEPAWSQMVAQLLSSEKRCGEAIRSLYDLLGGELNIVTAEEW